jgi:hypothetical protein
MRVLSHGSIIALALLACDVASLRADYSESCFNQFGRWFGYGWSSGYHAYDECPTCRRAPPPATYLHWQPMVKRSTAGGSGAPMMQTPVMPTTNPPTEVLPNVTPTTPDSSTKPARSLLPKAVTERRVLKPSQQSRPLPAPLTRPMPLIKRLPPVASNDDITPIEMDSLDVEPVSSEPRLLPTSATLIVSPPASSSGYPLSR